MALAKLAGEDGAVTVPYATIARRAFITPALAKTVIEKAAESGVLRLVEANGKTLSAVFPRWERWQPRDVTGAGRKRAYRARKVTEMSRD